LNAFGLLFEFRFVILTQPNGLRSRTAHQHRTRIAGVGGMQHTDPPTWRTVAVVAAATAATAAGRRRRLLFAMR